METKSLSVLVLATLLIFLEIYSSYCEKDECYDDDKCDCKKKFPKCQNAMQGTHCLSTEKTCKGMKFKKDQCRRKDTYISYHGALCKIEADKGDCKHEKVVMGVNCGGPEHTDVNGITYKAYATAKAKSEKNSINEETEIEEFSGAPEEDKPLYETYIWGDGDKINDTWIFWACAEWSIPFKEGGNYELTVKTLEPSHAEALKRSFSIALNKKPVAVEIDVFSITGKKGAALDIIIPFKISPKVDKITVFGQPEAAFKDKKVLFGVCHGVCKMEGGEINYVVSAFSVTKVKLSDEDEEGGDDEGPSGKNKGKGDGKPWPAGTNKKKGIPDDGVEIVDCDDEGNEITGDGKDNDNGKPWPAGTNKKKGIPDDGVEIVDCDDEGNEVSGGGKAVSTKKPGKGELPKTTKKAEAKPGGSKTTTANPKDKGKKTTTKKAGAKDVEEFVDCDDDETGKGGVATKEAKPGGKKKTSSSTEEPDEGPIGGRSAG